MEAVLARRLWWHLESINAVTYFSPECRDAMTAVGLRGFWMGYFAARSAPMGAVTPGVIEATFFNFEPAMIRRAIPDAWRFSDPATVLAARARAAAAAIDRLAPEARPAAETVVPRLREVIDGADGAGRPLFAANRTLETGADVEGLWQCATTLREHRGDGHVAILTERGLDGCEAHVLFAAVEGVDAGMLRDARGWSNEGWAAAAERLRTRRLLASATEATDRGRALRAAIEDRTDELAVAPFAALGVDGVEHLLAAMRPIAQRIAGSGDIRYPNPMGLPPIDGTLPGSADL